MSRSTLVALPVRYDASTSDVIDAADTLVCTVDVNRERPDAEVDAIGAAISEALNRSLNVGRVRAVGNFLDHPTELHRD